MSDQNTNAGGTNEGYAEWYEAWLKQDRRRRRTEVAANVLGVLGGMMILEAWLRLSDWKQFQVFAGAGLLLLGIYLYRELHKNLRFRRVWACEFAVGRLLSRSDVTYTLDVRNLDLDAPWEGSSTLRIRFATPDLADRPLYEVWLALSRTELHEAVDNLYHLRDDTLNKLREQMLMPTLPV